MAKIKTRTLKWDASSSPDVVTYRVYYTTDGSAVGYDSPSKDFPAPKTSVVIPDEFPELKVDGTVNIAVTPVDGVGNEGDLTVVSAQFDFLAPAAVTNLVVL